MYGNKVTVFTDHAAVKAVLGVPNLNGKHARWWSKVYGSGIREIDIVYRAGKHNTHADALSRQPILLPPPEESCDGEVQVAQITSEDEDITISTLLEQGPTQTVNGNDFADEQHKDMDLQPIINYLEKNQLPKDHRLAQRIITEATLYTMSDGILYYVHRRS